MLTKHCSLVSTLCDVICVIFTWGISYQGYIVRTWSLACDSIHTSSRWWVGDTSQLFCCRWYKLSTVQTKQPTDIHKDSWFAVDAWLDPPYLTSWLLHVKYRAYADMLYGIVSLPLQQQFSRYLLCRASGRWWGSRWCHWRKSVKHEHIQPSNKLLSHQTSSKRIQCMLWIARAVEFKSLAPFFQATASKRLQLQTSQRACPHHFPQRHTPCLAAITATINQISLSFICCGYHITWRPIRKLIRFYLLGSMHAHTAAESRARVPTIGVGNSWTTMMLLVMALLHGTAQRQGGVPAQPWWGRGRRRWQTRRGTSPRWWWATPGPPARKSCRWWEASVSRSPWFLRWHPRSGSRVRREPLFHGAASCGVWLGGKWYLLGAARVRTAPDGRHSILNATVTLRCHACS